VRQALSIKSSALGVMEISSTFIFFLVFLGDTSPAGDDFSEKHNLDFRFIITREESIVQVLYFSSAPKLVSKIFKSRENLINFQYVG